MEEILRERVFTTLGPTSIKGGQVNVFVDVEPVSSRLCDLTVILEPRGNHESLARDIELSLEHKRAAGLRALPRPGRTDFHGMVTFRRLPAGEYRLALANTMFEGARFTARLCDAALDGGKPGSKRKPRAKPEPSSKVAEPLSWSITLKGGGDVEVAVETRERVLAGLEVVYQIVDLLDEKPVREGVMVLDPAVTKGRWEGRCTLVNLPQIAGEYEVRYRLGTGNRG